MNLKEKLNSKFRDFLTCLTFLNEENDVDPSILVDQKRIFTSIQSIKKLMLDKEFIEENINWTPLVEFKFDQFLVNLLSYFSMKILSLDLENFTKNSKIINDRQILILNDLIQITYTFSEIFLKDDTLYKFVAFLLKQDLVEVLISFFNNEVFKKEFSNGLDFHSLLISIVRIIRNLTEDINYLSLFSKRNDTNLSGKLLFHIQLESTLAQFSSECKHGGYLRELNEINFNLKQKKLEKCIQFLKEMETEKLKILESDDAYNDLLYVYRLVQMRSFKDYDVFSNNQFDILISKLFGQIYELKNEMVIDESVVIQKKYPSLTLENNEKLISIFYYLLTIANYLKIDSPITVKTYMKYYMKFLEDDTFIKKLKKIAADATLEILFFLQKISINADFNKKDWSGVSRILTKFLNKGENSNEEILISHWIICYTCDEKIEKNKSKVSFLFSSLFSGTKFSQLEFSLSAKIDLLIRCASNHCLHEEIYEQFNKYIKQIIFINDDLIEKFQSLKLLALLCFNENILKKVTADDKFCKYILSLTKDKNSKISNVSKILEWSLSANKQIKLNKKDQLTKKNIFISSSHASRTLICRLENILTDYGFKIFFSTLNTDQVKTAIEKCDYILICINEKFRRSERTQFEFRFATSLSKPVVPICIQEGFEENVDGWIGQMLTRIKPINFVKKDFDEIVDNMLFEYLNEPARRRSTNSLTTVDSIETIESFELEELDDSLKTKNINLVQQKNKKEIEEINSLSPPKINLENNTVKTNSSNQSKMPLKEWDEKMVSKWFSESKINNEIQKVYSNINGSSLEQILKLRKENPEFFKSQLLERINKTIDQADVDHFYKCMELLEKLN